MQRRDALRNIGLSLGYIAATPTIISLLNSCTEEKEPDWMPASFSKADGELFAKTLEIILPETDTPGARTLDIPQFLDQFVAEAMPEKQAMLYTEGFNAYKNKVMEVTGLDAEELHKAKTTDLEPIIAETLKKSKDEEVEIYKVISTYQKSIEDGTDAKLAEGTALYAFMNDTRSLAIWAFKANEYIGEQVLAYESIPGRQAGCVDLQETTGGKAWSLS
ncbi:Gluconate 2-dehydrogenase subunit 3 [Pustulibacterium marinum]|uniref:Gluconate 2-dehydrogenase subunit 3 n=1 Tax=Pustulibacterium marinum TaxID=1224947 RepID=A0A1I7I7W0_9FLAO|nr:gluconate 2-dehydrogenase subunit 3 family protein [Pustulibacterium marinum]SFU69018.1 Gluconate 2-dehydrogenase subunit 3 [Pustulibacterium marinum]